MDFPPREAIDTPSINHAVDSIARYRDMIRFIDYEIAYQKRSGKAPMTEYEIDDLCQQAGEWYQKMAIEGGFSNTQIRAAWFMNISESEASSKLAEE